MGSTHLLFMGCTLSLPVVTIHHILVAFFIMYAVISTTIISEYPVISIHQTFVVLVFSLPALSPSYKVRIIH